MSYSYEDTTWSGLDLPLGAYRNLSFEDFDFESQLFQKASHASPKQPQPSPSTSSNSLRWDSDNALSSSVYPYSQTPPLPSLSRTLESSPDLFPIPSGSSSHTLPTSPFTTPLQLDDNYDFFPSIDLLVPLDSDFFNSTANPPVVSSPEPVAVVGHRAVSPPSKKRTRTNEESEYPENASEDVSSNHKRRKLSIDSHQNQPNVLPPIASHNNSNSNVTADTFENFNVLTENDEVFIRNLDPSLFGPNVLNNVINPSIPHAPEPVAQISSPSRKRHHYSDEEYDSQYYASSNLNLKRQRLSAHDSVPPHPHYYNNVPPDVMRNHHAPTSESLYMPTARLDLTDPNRAIGYQAGQYISSNANLYLARGDHNAYQHSLSYVTPLSGRTNGPSDTKNIDNADAFGTTPNTSASGPFPPFLRRQLTQSASYPNDAVHTDAYANNATHSGVDNRQHSSSAHQMSKIGYTANASMPSTCVPSTRGTSSAEPVMTFKFYNPTPTSPSAPNQVSTSRRRRRGPQATPAKELWRKEDVREGREKTTIYTCLYDGPAKPGGCGQKIVNTLKNLGRHMRVHACAESKMDISEAEKIALNSLPEKLRFEVATCFLQDSDLHHCAYYAAHGKRWEEKTLQRGDNLSRIHNRRNHPPHLQLPESKPQKQMFKPRKKRAKKP